MSEEHSWITLNIDQGEGPRYSRGGHISYYIGINKYLLYAIFKTAQGMEITKTRN